MKTSRFKAILKDNRCGFNFGNGLLSMNNKILHVNKIEII